MRGMDKEIRTLVRLAVMQGWRRRDCGSGHIMLYPCDRNVQPVLIPRTPHGGKRGIDNARAQLRKHGLEV